MHTNVKYSVEIMYQMFTECNDYTKKNCISYRKEIDVNHTFHQSLQNGQFILDILVF